MLAAIYEATDVGLRVDEVPDPVAGAGQLLVRVRAAGLNRADLLVRSLARRGHVSRRVEDSIAGGELAGEVVTKGDGVDGWELGARVMGQGRGYAQLAVVDAATAIPMPKPMTWEEAGALPVALLTMHDALRTHGHLRSGGSVMINAATSGVGIVGVAMAAQLGAGVVVATSRSGEKLGVLREFVEPLGCDLVTLVAGDDAAQHVLALTEGKGVDAIIDNVGGSVLAENLEVAAIGGRIIQVGRLGGRTDTLDLDELARKRVSIVGVTFRTRTRDDVIEIVARCVEDLGDRLERCRPRIAEVFALDQAVAAQDRLAENAHVGKIVLVP